MKILLITHKIGTDHVGGRRWALFLQDKTFASIRLQVNAFLSTESKRTSKHETNQYLNKRLNFIYLQTGNIVQRIIKKILLNYFCFILKYFERKWLNQIKQIQTKLFDVTIITVPPFNILELLNDIEIHKSTKLILDIRDPIPQNYNRIIKKNIKKINCVLNVSNELTCIFQKNNYANHINYATICNSYIRNNDVIASSDAEHKYILLIGTVYKEIADKFFLLINDSLKKINNNNDYILNLVVYSQIDPFLAKIKYSCYEYIKFNSFSYKPLDSTIQKCVCGIVPLWSDRYEGFGTKTFDFLSSKKKTIVIQENIKKSEFFRTFNADPNLYFIDYSLSDLTNSIYDCLSNSFIPSNYDMFDSELNSKKLYRIVTL